MVFGSTLAMTQGRRRLVILYLQPQYQVGGPHLARRNGHRNEGPLRSSRFDVNVSNAGIDRTDWDVESKRERTNDCSIPT